MDNVLTLAKKEISWDAQKEKWLKVNRGINLELVSQLIKDREIVDILDNPSYPGQIIIIIVLYGYIHCVPCLVGNDFLIIKTVYPNRKLNRLYGHT